MKRAYGSNTYWIERYAKRQATDDETSEWLIAAAQLGPLLSEMLPRDAAVLDVGCGNSPLVFDLLRDSIHGENSRALAVDIAPVAIQDMTDEQRARIRRGEASARRVALLCADLTQPPAGWLEENRSAYDASIDKSTTDGMLCDTRRGAQRVRALYGVVGAVSSCRGGRQRTGSPGCSTWSSVDCARQRRRTVRCSAGAWTFILFAWMTRRPALMRTQMRHRRRTSTF